MTDQSHTPLPWRLATRGNIGSLIEGYSGKHLYDGDDGFRAIASFQECCASEMYLDQQNNREANGALIVRSVNSLPSLVKALEEIAAFPYIGAKAECQMMLIARAALTAYRGEGK